MVHLILHGELRQYAPGKVLEVRGAGLTVADVLSGIGVPEDATAAYVVNGEQCEATARLADGDTVEVLPAISGGARAERGSGSAGPSEPTSPEHLSGRRPRD